MQVTEYDVINLLKELKSLVEKNTINLPLKGAKLQKEAFSTINIKNKFIIDIFRGKIDDDKYSFNARYANTNTAILRIDTGDVVHSNPDGQIIRGPHMHVFKDNQELREAIPFDISNKDIVDVCKAFLELMNIINYPQIVISFTMDDFIN